jgi:hypothetical protein
VFEGVHISVWIFFIKFKFIIYVGMRNCLLINLYLKKFILYNSVLCVEIKQLKLEFVKLLFNDEKIKLEVKITKLCWYVIKLRNKKFILKNNCKVSLFFKYKFLL